MKYLTYPEIVKILSKEDQERFLVGGTSVRPGDALQKIITAVDAKRVVEIGTGFGTSAIAIASCECVEFLLTLDIKNSVWPEYLAKKFGLDHKIHFIPVDTSQEIYEIIKAQDFDFAYIDGAHIPPFVENDFNAVKHIGRVLFDDAYSKQVAGVAMANNAVKVNIRFAYWSETEDYSTIKKIKGLLNPADTLNESGKLVHDYDYLKKH